MRRMLVLLNASAGTVRDFGAERLRTQVDSALTTSDMDVEVRVVEPKHLTDAIKAVKTEGFDTLVVGAGDGTLSYAASVLAGTDVALGVLPLGTMNLLAHDIGLPRDLPGALEGLRAARPMRIDLGALNGRPFHGVSGVGFFSQMALAREQERHTWGRATGWLIALGKALVRSGRMKLSIEVDGELRELDAYAALVTSNAFDAAGWHRSRLDGGLLEVHVAEERGALARVKAGADLLVDTWRNNPGIHSMQAKRVTISARRRRTWVATDGEITREDMPLRYEIMPKALTLLMPPQAVQWSAGGAQDAETATGAAAPAVRTGG